MRRGFSAGNILLSAICLSFAGQAFAEEQPATEDVAKEIIVTDEIELAPLPVPRPVQIETAGTAAGSGAAKPLAGEAPGSGEAVVTAAAGPAAPAADEMQVAPLPVPRPGAVETAEIEAGTGAVAFVGAEPADSGDAVVIATSTAAAPSAAEETEALRRLVTHQAERQGVPAALADAVVTVESRYDPEAEGDAGEIGLMQIKPETARLLGFRGPDSALFHPATNVRWGIMYLAQAQRRGGGTVCGTILKYNAGHGATEMNPVSEAYCEKVKALLRAEPT